MIRHGSPASRLAGRRPPRARAALVLWRAVLALAVALLSALLTGALLFNEPVPDVEVSGSGTPAQYATQTVRNVLASNGNFVTDAADGEAFVTLSFREATRLAKISHRYSGEVYPAYQIKRAALGWSEDGATWHKEAETSSRAGALDFFPISAGAHRLWRITVLESGTADVTVFGNLSLSGSVFSLVPVVPAGTALLLAFVALVWTFHAPDLRGLARVSWLVGRTVFPVALGTGVLLGIAYVGYRISPQFTRNSRFASADTFVVLEQLRRSTRLGAVDLDFIGDSSCLMGIDVPILMSSFPGRSIESLCMLAFVGPEGYAAVIDRMIGQSLRPKRLVLVFHPIQFRRDLSWDSWVRLVRSGGVTETSDLEFPTAGLDFLRVEGLAPLLYRPLPGAYGLFYGGAGGFISTIASHHGSAVDPGSALAIGSFQEFESLLSRSVPQQGAPISYVMNDLFERSLEPLAKTLDRFGRDDVYLIVSPVPQSNYGPQAELERREAIETLERRLGLSPDHLIKSVPSLPDIAFSSQTHLNRWGRVLFTRDLATRLAGVVPER